MISFTECISQINEKQARSELVENKATYKQMMQGVFQALQQVEPEEFKDAQRQFNVYINTYKRSDRIIWILRWYRAYLVSYIPMAAETNANLEQPVKEKIIKWCEKAGEKYFGELQRNMLMDVKEASIEVAGPRFMSNMTHYLSYVDENSDRYIDKIARTVFEWQSPNQLLYAFETYETEWQENREREIDHAEDFYDNAEMIMQFEDGFAWWNINQEYCDAEGNAMGHCGNNQGRSGSGDRVLSLRQDIKRGGTRKQVPYLTFILDEGDYLGEMKGRANEKPTEKYHKFIVPLLLSNHVSGIKGGGHDPANNFSINDLESDVRDNLLSKKPELGSSIDIYSSEGFTERFQTAFYNDLDKHNISQINDLTKDHVILEDLGSFDQLGNHFYWKPLEEAIAYDEDRTSDDDEPRTDFSDDEIRSYDVSEDTALDIFHYLPDEYAQIIIDDIGLNGSASDRRVKSDAALRINSSKYADILIKGILTVFHEDNNPTTISDEEWKEYKKILVDTVQSGLQYADAYITIGDDGDYYLQMDLSSFLSQLDDIDDEYGDSQLRYVSEWTEYDDYNMNETWKELINSNDDYNFYDKNNIVPSISGIVKNGVSPELEEIDMGKVDFHQVARWFMKWIDINESEENQEDAFIFEIKRRAGII